MIDWDALLLSPLMDVFGEGVPSDPSTWPTYIPTSGPSFQLRGAVFDSEYIEVTTGGEGFENTSQHPVLGVRLSLFPSPPVQDDKVTIPSVGATYRVREVQPDGHGHAKLVLMGPIS